MNDWRDLDIRNVCTDAVRNEIATMTPVIVEMARDTGPTDLTPFSLIALAAVNAFVEAMGGRDGQI